SRSTIDDLLQALASALPARRAVLLLVDDARPQPKTAAATSTTTIDWMLIAGSYWKRVAEQAEAVWIEERRLAAMPITPALAITLRSADARLLGAIAADMPRPDAAQVDLATAMGRIAAATIEQTRLAEMHRADTVRQKAILDIVRELDSHLDLTEVLAAICQKTGEAFGVRPVSIFFYSRRLDTL